MDSLNLTEDCEFMDFMEKTLGMQILMLNSVVTHIPYIKNNHISEFLRSKGNEYFQKKEYLASLKEYTKSLYYAENDSLEEKLAYANRSSLLLHRGFYTECLQDIERALKNDYPEEKKFKLLERKEKAVKLLPNQTKKLCRGPVPEIAKRNPSIPSASCAITFAKNEKYGTFIQATRDIKLGEVLLVEDPYAFAVAKDYFLLCCSACGKKCFNMIPCKKCFALYCSESCKQQAFKQYHEYECVLERFYLDTDLKNGYSNQKMEQNFRIITRIMLKALKDLKSDKHGNSAKGQHHSDCYEEFKNLKTNREQILLHLSKRYNVEVMQIIYTVQLLTKFTDIETRFGVNYKFLKGLYLNSLHIKHTNGATTTNLEKKQAKMNPALYHQHMGVAIYSAFSRFNHACASNVCYQFIDATVVARACRSMKKGEQCFISYIGYCGINDREARQAELLDHHYLACDCKACKHDWPTFASFHEDPFQDFVQDEKWPFDIAKCEVMRALFVQCLADAFWMILMSLYEKVKYDEPSPAFYYLDSIMQHFFTETKYVEF